METRSTRFRGLIGLLGIALFGVWVVRPASAQRDREPPVLIENIWVGLVEGGSDPIYKLGTWTPVRVDLQAGPELFQGYLRVTVSDDGGVPTEVYRRVEVPARATRSFQTYVRPGEASTDFRVAVFREGSRRPVARAVEELVPWVDPGQTVIGTIGNVSGLDLVSALPEFQPEQSGTLVDSELLVAPLRTPDGLPDRWYGYDALDALVLDTNHVASMEALQDFRGLPLIDWVRNGGHLILAVGDRWQAVASGDSVLNPLLPARPVGQTRTYDLGSIESFAGSNKPITTPEGDQVALTAFEPIPNRGVRIVLDDRSAGGPIILRGHHGLGRVTLVGLNVDQRPFVDWTDRGLFWMNVLNLQSKTPETASRAGGAFIQSELRDLATYLNLSLEQFEGVSLVPFGWVAFFVFLYILLIGPGDYLLLKYVLKRMELTWITFPSLVILVSVAAYVSAYAVKGTDLRINRVDVVDLDQAYGNADNAALERVSSFATLFSPRNRDYELTMLPRAVGDPESFERTPEPSEVDEVLLSWFGIAEQRFGGMGNTAGMGLTNTGYAYRSFGDELSSEPPERLTNLRVPIWTTKALRGTAFRASPPALEADLRDLGADRLEGTLTNRLDRELRDVIVAFGGEVYQFDRPIAPGETVRVDLAENRNLSGYLERIHQTIGTVRAYQTNPEIGVSRSDLIRALSFAEFGVTRGLKPNLVLEDLDLSAQLDLGRPILVADLDATASAFLIDGQEPETAEIDQTTVIRVLLPTPPSN